MADRRDRYTALSVTVDRYSDFTVNMDPHPHTNQVALKTNEEAVIQSMYNLIKTGKLEAIKQPHKGARIKSLLFDLITDQTTNVLREEIEVTLKQEPRIHVEEVIVIPYASEHYYQVSIRFMMINRVEPLTVQLALNRIR